MELLKVYKAFLSAVGKLNKSIYRLAQARRCWNTMLVVDLLETGFE